MDLRPADLDHPAVAALLAYHVAQAHSETPAGFRHALAIEGLRDAAIRLFAAWDGETLLGVAALRTLDDGHAEIKSMRTHPDHLRRGVARALLDRLLVLAQEQGLTRVSLETGTTAAFAPAIALYESFGFIDRDAFGGYQPSPHNRFMTLDLSTDHEAATA